MRGLFNPLLMATPTGGGSFLRDAGILVVSDCDLVTSFNISTEITTIQSCAASVGFIISVEVAVTPICNLTVSFNISTEIDVAQSCTVVNVG